MAKTSFPTALGITAFLALVGAFQAHAQPQNGPYGSQNPNTSGFPELGKGDLEYLARLFQTCLESRKKSTNQTMRSSKDCTSDSAACRAPQSPPNAGVDKVPSPTTEEDCRKYWERILDEWLKKTAEGKKR
jgi:hypothetical protein